MLKILVSGSREMEGQEDYDLVHARLSKLPVPSLIIHGAARGIDTQAGNAAESLGHYVCTFPALWKGPLGKSAGIVRNHLMADIMKPDLVIAFHTDPGLGRGTNDMVNYAKSKNIPVEIILK